MTDTAAPPVEGVDPDGDAEVIAGTDPATASPDPAPDGATAAPAGDDRYDFSRVAPPTALRDHVAGAGEVAASRAGRLIATVLRRDVGATCDSVTGTTPADVLDGATPFTLVAGGLDLLLGIPSAQVVALADALAGGPGVGADRAPTDLEVGLAARFLGQVLTPLADLVGADEGPRSVIGGGPEHLDGDDRLVGLTLRFTVDDLTMEVRAGLDPAVAGPLAPTTHERAPAAVDPRLTARLGEVDVGVTICFAPLTVAAADLEDLQPGDVLRLDHRLHDPLVGFVGEQPVVVGRPGRCRHNLAFEVLDLLDPTAAAPAAPQEEPAP